MNRLLVAALCGLALSLPPLTAAARPIVDRTALDPSVPAGKDFYQYANGSWLAQARIPADRPEWGPFSIIDERIQPQLRQLIEAVDPASAPADVLRAANFYRAMMDEPGIEARGLAPVAEMLKRIDAVEDRAALSVALGEAVRADVDPLNATNFSTANLLGIWVAPDLHDTDHYLPYLLQGGLSLPDREFYLAKGESFDKIRAGFAAHVERMFTLAGLTDAAARAAAVVDLEHRLAEGHAPRELSEDVLKADQVWSPEQLAARAPGLDWPAFLAAAGLAGQARLGIWHPDAMTAEARLVQEVPVAVWRDWLRLRVLDGYAAVLPKAFDQAVFEFYAGILRGIPAQQERWKRALEATTDQVGDALGQLYVARYFSPASKARIQDMVARIIASFDRRISRLRWMDPATRREARAKLQTLYVGIGFPEHWASYDGLEVRADDPVGNLARSRRFHRDAELARLGHPVDRSVWCLEPQVVNANNLPVQNALNFPASILQPPFFDPEASDAANYGSIGAVIGHEISHSFDDQGAQFDSRGTLRNWWTPSDFAHFKAASAKLVAQFSAYRPFPDLAVNGQQTLSENIADVAGLSAAYDALQSLPLPGAGKGAPAHAGKGAKPKASAAATAARDRDREFFLSFAQSWRELVRPEALRQQLVADGHAPARYRAQTVRNLDGWYRSFDVRPGQALYLAPRDRVQVW